MGDKNFKPGIKAKDLGLASNSLDNSRLLSVKFRGNDFVVLGFKVYGFKFQYLGLGFRVRV
jgi:hypothetical protein